MVSWFLSILIKGTGDFVKTKIYIKGSFGICLSLSDSSIQGFSGRMFSPSLVTLFLSSLKV